MQEYISKQQQILRPAEQIYAVISRFDNLTPAVADKVEEWQATEDTCSFKAKGFTVKLRMEERGEKLERTKDKLAKQKPPKKPGPVRRLSLIHISEPTRP